MPPSEETDTDTDADTDANADADTDADMDTDTGDGGFDDVLIGAHYYGDPDWPDDGAVGLFYGGPGT